VFGSLIDLINGNLVNMLKALRTSYDACSVDCGILDDDIIDLSQHKLTDILVRLHDLFEALVTQVGEGVFEHFDVDRPLLLSCTASIHDNSDEIQRHLKASDFNVLALFCKHISRRCKITYTVFNLFFHNQTGQRRDFKSFSKIFSTEMFAILRKLWSYALLFDNKIPSSVLEVNEIIGNNTVLPALSMYKRHVSETFVQEFPGFLKNNVFFC